MLLREILKDPNTWRYIQCSWFGRLTTFKLQISPNSPIRVSVISVQISRLFSRTCQGDFKFYVEKSKAKSSQTIFKKYKVSGLMLPDFKALFTKRVNKLHFNKYDF